MKQKINKKEILKGLKEGKMSEMFMDDWLIENAIDQGLPMNSVVADSVFMETDLAQYKDKILVTPTPHEGTVAEKAVLRALES